MISKKLFCKGIFFLIFINVFCTGIFAVEPENNYYDDEIFLTEGKKEGETVISADEKKIKRSFYDDRFRLSRREEWEIENIENSKITKLEEFFYDGDNIFPAEKHESKDNSIIKTFFYDDGQKSKVETYEVLDDEKPTSFLKMMFEYTYTKDGKLESEKSFIYEYKNKKYKKPSKTYTKQHVYSYHKDEEIPPDYEYFENGNLRIKTAYKTKDEYVTDTIFESNYTIRTFFKERRNVREEYYQDGVLIRTRDYE